MVAFHYIVCDVPRKEKYHVIKLIFINGKVEKSESYNMTLNQKISLIKDLSNEDFTNINESEVNLDTFLKNINLIRK